MSARGVYYRGKWTAEMDRDELLALIDHLLADSENYRAQILELLGDIRKLASKPRSLFEQVFGDCR